MTQSIKSLNRWQSALILFVAGALMALGFAPYHLWPVIFIGLPILYMLLARATNYRHAAFRAFMFGYGYSMAGTWWIGNALLVDADKFAWLLPFSILGLSAVMALWFGLFGALVYALRAHMNSVLFAVMWVLVEYARSVGIFGFPWNLLGYMSLASLPFAQGAALVGTYGLSLVLVLLGLVPVLWLNSATRRQKIIGTALPIFIVVALVTYGLARLSNPTEFTTITLRVVQPNVPQEVKGTREGQAIAMQSLGQFTVAMPKATPPDVTIWPETAYPFSIRGEHAHALPPVKLLLTGAVRAEGYTPHVKIWNSLVAMNGDGEVLATYDKHQLVPFGDFVPLRHVLPLDKITPGDLDFTRGSGPRTLTVGNLPPFSPLVCYEGIFPWMAIDQNHRPAWMLNVTNDAWYGDSQGPYQHFDMVRMRAIEQGLPMVRAANSGVSAVMDSYGRVVERMALNAQGFIDTALPAPQVATPYARIGMGNEFYLLIAFLFFIKIIGKMKQKMPVALNKYK
ncbi:MAG: apolipoprotein N-acyltransferase [Rickettsiales bacterium]|nr:apolipoprotein N-acyltransferase [Rickettsiales bacterium]